MERESRQSGRTGHLHKRDCEGGGMQRAVGDGDWWSLGIGLNSYMALQVGMNCVLLGGRSSYSGVSSTRV